MHAAILSEPVILKNNVSEAITRENRWRLVSVLWSSYKYAFRKCTIEPTIDGLQERSRSNDIQWYSGEDFSIHPKCVDGGSANFCLISPCKEKKIHL